MGCDIHFYVEKREGDAWVSADTWYPEVDGSLSTYDWSNGYSDPVGKPMYSGRNYDLFSILANVRNGYGFAGVDTGDGYRPISLPRGLPDDVSENVRKSYEHWDSDGHSHSHFTVAELMAYDWTQVTTRRGVVDVRELARWKQSGRPDSWAGSIDGGGIRHFLQEEGIAAVEAAMETVALRSNNREFDWWSVFHLPMGYDHLPKFESDPETGSRQRAFWDALTDRLNCERPVFRVSWNVTYSNAASEFLSDTMPKLWRIGKPEDVRIVFWFDN